MPWIKLFFINFIKMKTEDNLNKQAEVKLNKIEALSKDAKAVMEFNAQIDIGEIEKAFREMQRSINRIFAAFELFFNQRIIVIDHIIVILN